MQLKRIELFGFKSFADKTELELEKGITAVIGPNGCGKSNIVDAVKWALGEQSVKALRGNRMEEVIFSGSAGRKALNFAEVSLTFSGIGPTLDLDYEEVTVTRRIYRSGESEYLINNSPCRLKDITGLFLDTGAGREVYSIIGQGRVETIINSKPEDRREIFEEAAGILKYKLRKNEARRRLEETRENLVRVQDLVIELESQIEPLTGQAETARRYQDLRGQIDRAQKELLSHRLHLSREELAGVERRLQGLTDSLSETAARSGRQEEELQRLKLRRQEDERRHGELEQQAGRASREMERQENELRLLEERENHCREQISRSEQRLEQLAATIRRLGDEKESGARELQAKREAIAGEKENCRLLQEKMEQFEADFSAGDVERQQQRLYRAAARRRGLESALEEMGQQQERLSRRRESLLGDGESLAKEAAVLDARHAELSAAAVEAEKNAAKAAEQLAAAERHLEKLGGELAPLQQGEQRCREELGGLKSRLQLLRDQEAGLSGYYRGVREIIQNRGSLSGIVGPVVDLITVEKRFQRAIEAALGPALQYIVVDTESAALEAIRFLKERKLGWCTFLPLDTIRLAETNLERFPAWRDLEDVYGKASELVEVNPAYEKVVRYLLGSILICRDLKAATEAARLIKYSCRIISLEGDLINPGGAIRGGSMPPRSAGLPLGRRREIEELEQELALLHKKKQTWEEQIAGLKAQIGRAASEAAALRQNQAESAGLLRRAEKEAGECATAVRILKQRREGAAASLQELNREMSEIAARRKNLVAEEQTCAAEIALAGAELEGTKEIYRRSLSEKKKLDEILTAALLKLNSLQEQEQSLLQSREKISLELVQPLQEQQEKQREIAAFTETLAKIDISREKVSALLQQFREESAALMLKLEEHKKESSAAAAALMELEEQQRQGRKKLDRYEKRERHFAVEQSRLQTEIAYQLDRFKELFGPEEPLPPEPDFDAAECESLIGTLSEDIEMLGAVNLGAIDELARLQERINFLNEQQDDLRQGESSLHRIIGEIDERMAHFFDEAFTGINSYFQEVFSALFQGGKAYLSLTDPDNMLEAGIEIVAQPPGKRLQNISLLSTGEKSLAAVALIFAILRYKPAPFYLLDEVESSLDDINLTRFTSYLKEASREAQFILITHRRRTMEEADLLYGVTMPEEGVSNIVSLRLDEKVS